jgi:hypothetical protein
VDRPADSLHQGAVRIVYYDHALDLPQPGFRSGRADRVVLDADGLAESEGVVRIPPNSLHALHGHGVAEALDRLPLAYGRIVPRGDAVLRPTALSDASRILYEADRMTYGATHEFVAHTTEGERSVQYRIVIDNREYQRTLARLQYLVTLASREGHGVRLRL